MIYSDSEKDSHAYKIIPVPILSYDLDWIAPTFLRFDCNQYNTELFFRLGKLRQLVLAQFSWHNVVTFIGKDRFPDLLFD
jgi:hypothetical protein